jgi:DUF4097 and DUF4098 domain-containing protein YvlB
MSERVERFEISGTPVIQAKVPVGRLQLVEGAEGEVVVTLRGGESALARYRVEQTGDLIEIAPDAGKHVSISSVRITVESGTPPEVKARLASCDLSATCEIADLQVDTASGDVRVERVEGDAVIRSASGDIRIASVGGILKVTAASGDVFAGVVEGGADLKTASGDVKIRTAGGGIKAKCASGDVTVKSLTAGDFDAKTLSGDVFVGIPSGRTLEVDLDTVSGKVRIGFAVDGGSDQLTGSTSADDGVARVKARTVSGDVTLGRAESS